MLSSNHRIRRFVSYASLIAAAALPLTAAPTITAVENAASNIAPGFPNAGIAQGAIFTVYGSGLGPTKISIDPRPFQNTSSSGTSVSVTVGATTVSALMYYTSSGQVAALLPSNTPVGSGKITVTYNNQSSDPASISVVGHNLGAFTIDSSGTGPAIVTYPDYSLVSPSKAPNCGGPNTTCGAANPGDTLILWGTGLGAINGNDASGAGLGVSMPDIPLKVWLGGIQAQVTYQGRSGCCVGEDQIVFTVPDNIQTGCAVPLLLQINNQISNSTVLPVATGSRTCPDLSTPGLDASQLTTLGSVSLGDIELDHLLNDAGNGFVDQAQGFFAKISGLPAVPQAFLASYLDNQPLGTCEVIGPKAPSDVFFNNLVNNGYVTLLDGGTSFTVTGPNGSMDVPLTGNKSVLSASGAFLVPGDYTLTGNGGNDIGSFTAHITIPVTPTLTSPASAGGLSITRSNGLAVTWNANGSTGHVEIGISAFIGQNAGAQAICTAPASAGSFTVPPYVLLALPATSGANFYFQPGDAAGPAVLSDFTATGLTVGIAQSFMDGTAFGGVTLK